ncbi:MAG: hypothetical protein ACYSU5_24600, partial [Planctomycetota bacterium]
FADEKNWQVLMWLYSQFRDYAISRGMTETWARIDTGLDPDMIPDYVQTARRYQNIGYRTFTDSTNRFTKDATWLNQLNAQSDSWHMSYGHTPDFLALTRPTQGKAAVPLDEGDQFWYTEAGIYTKPYEEGRNTAWRALVIGANGYTFGAIPKTRSCGMTRRPNVSFTRPPGMVCGMVMKMPLTTTCCSSVFRPRGTLAALTGKTEDAPLRMIKVNYRGLVSYDIAGPIGFHQFNQAKREVLKMLCADQ